MNRQRPIRPGPFPSPVPFTEDNTRELLERARYAPDEPYPGRGTDPWRVACLLCGALVVATGYNLRAADKDRQGRPRSRCRHQAHTIVTPASERLNRANSIHADHEGPSPS